MPDEPRNADVPPPRRILIADDSATIRAQIFAALDGEYVCDFASDGAEALQKAMQLPPPDAIVLDLEMPRLDGLAVLRSLKAEPSTREIPVVVVTTVTSVEMVNSCRAQGCAGFVLKPVQPDYLRVKLRKLLSRKT